MARNLSPEVQQVLDALAAYMASRDYHSAHGMSYEDDILDRYDRERAAGASDQEAGDIVVALAGTLLIGTTPTTAAIGVAAPLMALADADCLSPLCVLVERAARHKDGNARLPVQIARAMTIVAAMVEGVGTQDITDRYLLNGPDADDVAEAIRDRDEMAADQLDQSATQLDADPAAELTPDDLLDMLAELGGLDRLTLDD